MDLSADYWKEKEIWLPDFFYYNKEYDVRQAVLFRHNSTFVFSDITLSEQGDTRFCTTDLWFCHVTVAQRTSSTLRSSALQNHKSEAQNSFGPQVPYFGGWQGNGMRRTGRTPIDVNAASRKK